jgi:predicted DCC family thiol-disulfide oxidoreductase YuxK
MYPFSKEEGFREMSVAKKQIRTQGIVLYDDTCGFCRKWVPFWGKTLRKSGFAIGSLQNPDVAPRLHLSKEEIAEDLRLLLDDGTQIVGANVYRYVMRRIWWAYPFYLLSTLPLFRNIFDRTYRTFKNNRYRISTTCRLKGADNPCSGN